MKCFEKVIRMTFDGFFTIHFHRISAAAYSGGIYKLPSDNVEKATEYKEAPIKDAEEILMDDETKRTRQNQSTLIQIPVEV